MAGQLLIPPFRATDANGDPLNGAKWKFYSTGTLTPATVYSDEDLSTSLGAVVTADAGGKFVPIYGDATISYRAILTTSADVAVGYDFDPISSGALSVLSSSSGSANVGFLQTGTGAVSSTVEDELQRYIYAAQFGTLQQALTEAAASGRVLKMSGVYNVATALSCGAVRIDCEEPVTINYTGSTHIHKVLEIAMAGEETVIHGAMVVNGNDKANIGLFIANENATRADLILGNIETRNCRMVSGSAFNAGASGIVIRGNVDTLMFDRLWADGIGRDAGTGSISNYGTTGVSIDRTLGYAPKVIQGRVIGANDITTNDSPGVAACVDVDGVAIFQNDETGAACAISLVITNDCQGRGFKGQFYRSAYINQVSVTRSISGITGGSSDINVQLGEGYIDRADVVYTGNADTVHGQGTVCFSAYTGTDRTDGYALAACRNLTVKDKCTSGTATINAIHDVTNGSTNTSNKFAVVGDTQLIGRTAKRLVNTGQNGSTGTGNFFLKIDGFIGALTAGLIACEAAPPNLKAVVSGVWNTGSTVPAIYRLDAVSLGSNFGRIIDGGGNVGVKRYRGTGGDPGLLSDAVNDFTSLSIAGGISPLLSGDFATGVSQQSDKFGIVAGTGILIMGCPDFGPPGIYTTSGNTITTVTAAVGVTVGSGGVDPGGLDFSVWKTDSSSRITVVNDGGSTRPFFALVIG